MSAPGEREDERDVSVVTAENNFQYAVKRINLKTTRVRGNNNNAAPPRVLRRRVLNLADLATGGRAPVVIRS